MGSSCDFSRYLFLSILISSITVVYLSKHVVPMNNTFIPFVNDPNPVQNPSNTNFLIYYINQVIDLTESYLKTSDNLSLLVFINFGFCSLYFWGTVLIKAFFGQLRDIESQFIYDRLLNFLLFKVVFIGAILEPTWNELYLWVTWFAVIGFLRLFGMLGRDRVDYLTHSPETCKKTHIRTFSFLCLILVTSIVWSAICLSSFQSMLFLLAFECLTLILETVQTLVKYCIHLKDFYSVETWEHKDIWVRRTEFYLDSAILLITLSHYVQVALIRGLSLSLINAVLFLNVRSVLKTLKRKFGLYRNYQKALNEMDTRFPSLTKEEIAQLQDPCPICREEMNQGKRLPCQHCFHSSCLRLWVESHDSCPVCRITLSKCNTDSNGKQQPSHFASTSNSSNFSSNPPSFPSSPRLMFQSSPLISESNIEWSNYTSHLRARSRNPSYRDLQSLDHDDFGSSPFRSLFSDESFMHDSDPFEFPTNSIGQDLPLAEVVDQMQRFNP